MPRITGSYPGFSSFMKKELDATTETDFLQGTLDVFGTFLYLRNYRKMLVQTKVCLGYRGNVFDTRLCPLINV